MAMTLSASEIEHFIENGFSFVRGALSKEFVRNTWEPRRRFLDRLQGFHDETHLFFPPYMPKWDVASISPRLDEALCQIIGGEERAAGPRKWGDGYVVAQPVSRLNLDNMRDQKYPYRWHKDGFHRHFLDSPEIGVIALVMWTASSVQNGATVLAGNSVKVVADKLAEFSEGLDGDYFDKNMMIRDDWCPKVLAEGDAGDVCLMHPMLLHSVRPNLSDDFRAVTNPFVPLASPMKFNRSDGKYSPVEMAILKALGVHSLDFQPAGLRSMSTVTDVSSKLGVMRQNLKKQLDKFPEVIVRKP